MKKLFIIFLSAIFFSVIWFVGCSDNQDSFATDVSGPSLGSVSQVKIFDKINFNKPGDPFSTPENFVEVTPVVWDGVSELKPGVTYVMTRETFAKTKALGKEWEEFYNFFMGLKAHEIDSGKIKSSGSSLAWVHGNANCIGNGYVYGEASARGEGTAISRAVVELDDMIYSHVSQPGQTAYKSAFCLSGCHHVKIAANDGTHYYAEECS